MTRIHTAGPTQRTIHTKAHSTLELRLSRCICVVKYVSLFVLCPSLVSISVWRCFTGHNPISIPERVGPRHSDSSLLRGRVFRLHNSLSLPLLRWKSESQIGPQRSSFRPVNHNERRHVLWAAGVVPYLIKENRHSIWIERL